MSKKEMLNNFFNQSTSAREEKTDNNTSRKKTNIHNRKIFDDPTKTFSEEIIELDTKDIYISPYKVDRENLDLQGIDDLSKNMESIGQLQPCTVRHNPNPNGHESFELIFGERRYRAAILRNLKLKVTVKDIDNESSALQLLSENRNREDNTDYQLFKQINKFISENILKQKDIVEKTGISKQKISKLMCFNKIPETITDNIQDFSNISATTAESIAKLSQDEKASDLINKIIKKIESGEYGHSKIKEYIDRNKEEKVNTSNKKIISSNGRHLFTIRKDNNNTNSIHFPKDIHTLFINDKINEVEFYNSFKEFMEKKLNDLN